MTSTAGRIDVQIHGLRELDRALKKLDRRLQRKTVRDAVRAGAVVMRRAIKQTAPVDRGDLRRGVAMRSLRAGRHVIAFGIGPLADVFYGSFHEFGTKDMSARPWIRPAFHSAANEAEKAITDKLLAVIYKGLPR